MATSARTVRPLIVFDMDGTLYAFREGSYRRSKLRMRVRANARAFLADRLGVSARRASEIFREIERSYGDEYSLGIEARFGIPRAEYFATVWDIPVAGLITASPSLPRILARLQRRFDLLVLSDAPAIWVDRVLRDLRVARFFRGRAIPGDGDHRKSLRNAFARVAKQCDISPSSCIVVGDQEHTDIEPARAVGMRTIFIHPRLRSTAADASIRHVEDLESAINDVIDGEGMAG